MAKQKKTVEVVKDTEPKIYEVGYHIVPTVSEDNLPEVVSAIKEIIEKNDGVTVSEELPTLMDLAYPMTQTVQNKKVTHNRAYFGWVKFQTKPELAEKIKEALDLDENVLRFIIIKTVRESTMISPKIFTPKPKEEKPKETKTTEEKKIDKEELDKTIDDLVIS